ncbi:MAG: FAD-binding oxidoreductase [Hyphomicrobiales bacterium]
MNPERPPSAETLDRLVRIVGEKHAVRDEAAMRPYLVEWRDRYVGRAALVLRPASTGEVSAILEAAHETRTAIVTQSGNTGLVGGQIPFESGHEVVLSLERMTAIRDVDPIDNSLVAEAGATLKSVQDAARDNGRLFPLSLASEGSCRIGGNLATNAGGVGVLAYGNARDLCLGLEVVLADGRVWNGLRRLRKDNTGYDLKDLFIGSEGTLGVITAAALKLFPAPSDQATALVAVNTAADALDLLALARDFAGQGVTAIELMPRIGIEFVVRHAALRDPFDVPSPWYVLLELSGQGMPGTCDRQLTAILEAGMERGLLTDALLAKNATEAEGLWRYREALSEVQKFEGGSLKHDVAVPVSRTPEFIERANAEVARLVPGIRPVPFGHIGDGNIHFNLTQPVGADKQAYLGRLEEVADAVHAIVLDLGGTISAEHGIGRAKRDYMRQIKDPVELELMARIKGVLDPEGLLNPGKLLP